jgi:hypothetical protein
MKTTFLIIACFISVFWANAQEDSDCSKTLKKAQQVYDKGEIEKVEELLNPCLQSDGFNRAEKTEALKLIILATIFDDNIATAENRMIELLKINPDFAPKSGDHQEIKDLYTKFRTAPLVIIDYTFGVNFTDGYVLKNYNVNPYTVNIGALYAPKAGINVGASAHYLLKNKWRAGGGIYYKTQSFNIFDLHNKEYGGAVEDTNFQIIDTDVNISQLEIPFAISKEFGNKKLVPHLGLGAAFGIYLSSNHTIQRSYSLGNVAPQQGTPVNTIAQQRGYNFSGMLNAGVRYKAGLTGKLIFEVRMFTGLTNQTNEYSRYENRELLFKYYFVPDDFLLHNLSINVGYSQLLYKPKKLNN